MSKKKESNQIEDHGYVGNRNKSKYRKTMRLRARMIGIIGVVFVFFYVPSFLYWVYSVDIGTDMIKMGTLEDSINGKALLVRDEIVITPQKGGIIIADVNEGERVQANSSVASIVNEGRENLLQELSIAEQNIIEFYKEILETKFEPSFEITKNEDEMKKKVLQLIGAQNDADLYKIPSVRTEIDLLMKKRVMSILSSPISDQKFEELKSKRQDIIDLIDANTLEIKTKHAGLVSFTVDGYEDRFSVESIKSIKPQDIRSIKTNTSFNVPMDSKVIGGKPVAKIIPDNEYYLVLVLKKEEGDRLKIKDSIQLRIIELDRTIKARVDYISDSDDNDECVVSIKTDVALRETAGLRMVDIKILKNQYRGYKVPLKSLTGIDEVNNKAKIMLIKYGLTKYVEVSIVATNDEFAIIENNGMSFSNGVNLYDIYVINSKNVKEGQFLN